MPEPGLDEEIDLYEMWSVIARRKRFVLAFFVTVTLAAAMISFLLPPRWEVSMVVEPGRVGSDIFESGSTRPTGKVYYIDTAENLKAKILQGAYDSQVRAKSGWPEDKEIEWEANVKKGTSAIKVAVDVEKKEMGIKALKALTNALREEYTAKVESYKANLEEKVAKAHEDINRLQKEIQKVLANRDTSLAKSGEQIKKLQAEISLLSLREKKLAREEENVRRNSQMLMAKRNELVTKTESSAHSSDPLGLILLTTSLQQNITYINQLLNQINDIKLTLESKGSEIKKTKMEMKYTRELASLNIQKINADIKKEEATIKHLEARKDFIVPLTIIQSPTVSIKPVKPKKRLVVAVAAVLSLFIGVFLAFFLEFLQKGRKRERVE